MQLELLNLILSTIFNDEILVLNDNPIYDTELRFKYLHRVYAENQYDSIDIHKLAHMCKDHISDIAKPYIVSSGKDGDLWFCIVESKLDMPSFQAYESTEPHAIFLATKFILSI